MENYDPQLHLISFDTCPFAERARLVLEHKELPYKLTLVDLKNKPDWLFDISPRGKVPILLLDEGNPIFESTVINEFLDEAYEEIPMLSNDVVERAIARSWIAFANEVLMPAYLKVWFSKGDEDQLKKGIEILENAWEHVENFLNAREEGPYFMGDQFTLVDAIYAPIITRRAAQRNVLGDLDGKFKTWTKYGDALLKADAVEAAQTENLTAKFKKAITPK